MATDEERRDILAAWQAEVAAANKVIAHYMAREEKAEAEVVRLQRIIDSRPAINAGLPETYIKWSQSIYQVEAAQAQGIVQ